MRLLFAVVVAGLVACAEQPRACGDWPALALTRWENERIAEQAYTNLLGEYVSATNKDLWRRFAEAFPDWKVLFFFPGEPLAVLRFGEVSSTNVLVKTAAGPDRFWTAVEETACR